MSATDGGGAAQTGKAAGAQGNLDAKAWLDAAFDALAVGGIDAVRIDQMAKTLGVTRGSFYWHFKNREALHTAMLREWRKRANFQVYERLERSSEPPATRLRRLAALPQSGPRAARAASIELAIRLWARRDPKVAHAVRVIDRARLNYYENLLVQNGATLPEAKARAYLFYAYLMAEAIISADEDGARDAKCRAFLIEPPTSS